VSFSEAMEGLSLAAIMARMAEDEEERGGRIGSDQEGEAKRGRPGTAAEVIDAAETDAARQTTHRHDVGASTPLLSESFKAGTAASHQAAENVHFVKEFIKGKIDRTLYGELVIMLYHVYAMLETCLEQNSSNAHLNPFQQFHKRLRRTETLEEDVDFWHGSDKAERVLKGDSIESPACRDYVERLRTITEQDPLLLLAHSYTRYLGDLSGGKILARVARKAMNLGKPCPSGAVDGLAFYHFAEIDSAKQFKDAYRKAMDELPLTTEQVSRLVGEANVAFALNMRLFEELDVQAKVPGAAVRPLQEALAYAEVDVQIETAKKDEKCPFAKMQEMSSKGAEAAHAKSGKRCPWPFILAHDPVEGLKDWQTWAVLGLVLCYLWSKFVYHQ
jgi:heme oxygenase